MSEQTIERKPQALSRPTYFDDTVGEDDADLVPVRIVYWRMTLQRSGVGPRRGG